MALNASSLLFPSHRFVRSTAMASCAQQHRPPMLDQASYAPPSWASHLHPLPSQFVSLGQFPTPIHRWNLPDLPDGVEIWIKRDDLTGMQLSGNKVRKLEFILAAAKSEGADCVITLGGIQSNHCRATAVAANYLNLGCYLILRTNRTQVDEDPGLVGNLLVERMVGAQVELVSKEEYQHYGSEALGMMLKERLIRDGHRPFVIPVGGSNSLGAWGYVQAVKEIEDQLREKTCPADRFDDIVVTCGSGGTTAGVALASHLSSLKARVHAYGVCDDPEYFYDYIQGILDGMNANVASRDIVDILDAKGLGYAMSTSAELKIVKEVAERTGIVLDPVYTGKALVGLLKDVKEKPEYWAGRKVLFIHTGGLLGVYDKLQQLQPLIGNWKRFQLPESALGTGTNIGKMF